MDIKKYEGTANNESEGIWVEMDAGYKVKIRGANSAAVRKLRQRQLERNKRFHRKGSMVPVDIQTSDNIELICEAVLLDWSGIVNGNLPLPFNVENVKLILDDPDLLFIKDDILIAMNELDLFVSADQEEDQGN